MYIYILYVYIKVYIYYINDPHVWLKKRHGSHRVEDTNALQRDMDDVFELRTARSVQDHFPNAINQSTTNSQEATPWDNHWHKKNIMGI